MMNQIRNIFLKKYPKNIIPCGRDPCYCINELDLFSIKEFKYYKECYQSWYVFFKIESM